MLLLSVDALTALEHLHFYARARGVADVEHNVEQVRENRWWCLQHGSRCGISSITQAIY